MKKALMRRLIRLLDWHSARFDRLAGWLWRRLEGI